MSNEGNGAREAVEDVFGWTGDVTRKDADGRPIAPADWFLSALWLRGFKVVPIMPPATT